MSSKKNKTDYILEILSDRIDDLELQYKNNPYGFHNSVMHGVLLGLTEAYNLILDAPLKE